jgi:hypothetical protein
LAPHLGPIKAVIWAAAARAGHAPASLIGAIAPENPAICAP